MAEAPRDCAYSVIRLLKPSTRTFSRCATEDRTNAMRSPASNIGCFLTDPVVTATTTSSNRVAARAMMSMCPYVTGSYVPGHTAMRWPLELTGTPPA